MYYQDKVGGACVIQRIPSIPRTRDGYGVVSPDAIIDELLIVQVLEHYQLTLLEHEQARRFLLQHGISGNSLLSNFRLGFADRSLGLRLQKLGKEKEAFTRGALQRLGLLKPSGHEFFRGCVIFPFVTVDGEITGAFGKRITPKLKAGSVYQAHWISSQTGFFNETALTQYPEVIVCKNPLDAVIWWQYGFKNVVSLMSSDYFSELHLKRLQALPKDRLYLALGSTASDVTATWKVASALTSAGFPLSIVLYPGGVDMETLIKTVENPVQALSELLTHSITVNPA